MIAPRSLESRAQALHLAPGAGASLAAPPFVASLSLATSAAPARSPPQTQIRKLETDKEIEATSYIRRVEKLSSDIERLRCNTATGRRKAYFNKIKRGLATAMGRGSADASNLTSRASADTRAEGADDEDDDEAGLEHVPFYQRHLAAKLAEGKLLSADELESLRAPPQDANKVIAPSEHYIEGLAPVVGS